MNSLSVLFLTSLFYSSFAWKYTATERPDLEKLFNPQQQGWLGADGSESLRLTGDTYLWLWQDTIVGNLYTASNGTVVRNCTSFPHSSVALVNNTNGNNGNPTFILPQYPNGSINTIGNFEPQNPTDQGEFYWNDAGMIAPQSGYLLVTTITNKPTSGFPEQLGTDIVVVTNPTANPNSWNYKTSRIPGTSSEISLNDGIVYNPEDGHIYLAGLRNSKGIPEGVVLARILEKNLISFNWTTGNLQFWSTNQWVNDITQTTTIFLGPYTESTIFYHNWMKQWYMVCCQAYDLNIYVATAPSLTGPWNKTLAYVIPPPWSNGTLYTTYAAAAHPEYTKNDTVNQIIFTYNTNAAQGLNELFSNINIYHPLFIQLTISD